MLPHTPTTLLTSGAPTTALLLIRAWYVIVVEPAALVSVPTLSESTCPAMPTKAPGGLTDPGTKVTPAGSVSVSATSNASDVLVASCETTTEKVTTSPSACVVGTTVLAILRTGSTTVIARPWMPGVTASESKVTVTGTAP